MDDSLRTSRNRISQVLRHASGIICQRWGREAEQAGLDSGWIESFIASMPDCLTRIANRVDQLDDETQRVAGLEHPADLLTLHRTLSRIAIEECASQLGRPLDTNETIVLTEALASWLGDAMEAHAADLKGQLDAASQSQSKYLSFLSHDLRGGLNGVFLMVEVLRRELADRPDLAETMDDLELMRRSLLETVATMDRFLYAERFRKGKVRVKPGPVSLKTIVNEIVSRFAHQAREEGIELTGEIPERGEVHSDRELLLLTLHSLVANAIKFAGKGHVFVRAQKEEQGWAIAVSDEGPGIASEQLATIRAALESPAPDQPGPGLGLSLASQSAKLVGARLEVESQEEKGATFVLHVPTVTGSTEPRP